MMVLVNMTVIHFATKKTLLYLKSNKKKLSSYWLVTFCSPTTSHAVYYLKFAYFNTLIPLICDF